MKILIPIHFSGLFGCLRELIFGLKNRGHELKLFQSQPFAEDISHLDGLDVEVLPWYWFDLKPIFEFKPDKIVFFNGHGSDTHAALTYLRSLFDTVIIELGWIPQNANLYIADNLAPHSSFIMDMPVDIPPPELADLKKSYSPIYDASLPEKFIFVPAQLDFDTSITISSPVFKDCSSFLSSLLYFADGIPVVIKNHPKQLEAPPRPQGALVYTGTSRSIDLAAQATLVAGITSTVLTEALLFNRHVFSFGHTVSMKAHMNATSESTVFPLMSKIKDIFYNLDLFKPERSADDVLSWLLSKQWDYKNPPEWVYAYIEKGKTS